MGMVQNEGSDNRGRCPGQQGRDLDRARDGAIARRAQNLGNQNGAQDRHHPDGGPLDRGEAEDEPGRQPRQPKGGRARQHGDEGHARGSSGSDPRLEPHQDQPACHLGGADGRRREDRQRLACPLLDEDGHRVADQHPVIERDKREDKRQQPERSGPHGP